MDTTQYKIKVAGTIMPERYASEHVAVAAAQEYLQDYNPEDVSVHYVSTSGTERSTMQVWPTVGNMYSEHR